jgi:putative tricarboxylic transport membrane protein
MKIHDSLLGLLFVMIGAAILFTVAGYPKMPGQDVGPAMFPGVMAAALVIFGGTLALRGRVLPGSHRLFELREWSQSPRHILAGLSVVLGCAAYALFSTALGFLILAPILLFVWHLAFGVSARTSLVSALLTTIVAWGVFYKGLGVPLPWGLLKQYAF